ncbi:T9SS type A sorting domain-containing protein [Aequorivita sp. H23M31]|uniref:T9SS type A sorting domain-containing protein n=1 Tax=Aequorivita ciconiae TaxID=2494375 RepID=A0A410FZJ6_9FLAO|nr:T9SS type A sorting domain-containing protein [Aequorivita sp. H23M31]QAA80447.1 T9SS type A sorting domain-containing protein [Aequorivita sp. H23M31]
MKQFLLLLSLALAIFSVQGQSTKKVLFIGNSYTAVNNLPLMVSNMANSTGDELIYDSNSPGGYRFMNHASDPTTLAKINSNNWDYVVLQAQSQETSLSEAQMQAEVYPYAESLSNAIRTNNECSQPLFYMTWGRENGDPVNCADLPWVCTYEGMDDVIRATYIFMSDSNDAELAPAGAVWRYIRENHPSINLYSPDESHPSMAGSYAVACAFYAMIYKKDPTSIPWNSTLNEPDANLIKMAAKNIVYDVISTWDFTQKPIADFSETINGGTVSFTNTSTDFDTIFWEFGDGNTSTEVNPTHTYFENGIYTVSQTIGKCGKSDTKIKTVEIQTLNKQIFNQESFSIYPNPAHNILNLKLKKNYKNIQIIILNLSGKTVFNQSVENVSDFTMDISSLSKGLYLIKIAWDNIFYIEKMIKN